MAKSTHTYSTPNRDAATYAPEPRWSARDVETWDMGTLDVMADSEAERARDARSRGEADKAAQHSANARELDRIRAARMDAMAAAFRDPSADVGAMILREFSRRPVTGAL